MQEEVTQRTVSLCVEATKFSAGMLQQAMKKVLDEMQKGVTGHKTKLHHGKQTLRQLMKHNTRVYKTTRDGKRLTLEDECLQSCSLPSIAYGFKRCSLKHKIGPQEKFCNHYPPCRRTWAAGKRVVKFIGYDAGEGYRSDKVLLGDLADRKYSKWYPLMEWGWTRDDCIRQIEAAGLPQPGKSSCFFAPA